MLGKNRTILKEKLQESLSSVVPVTLVMFVLCFTVSPIPNGLLMAFILGAVLLIVGMGLFTLGADLAMTPMGNYVGSSATRTQKLVFAMIAFFLVGALVTIAEPDLQVLAGQVPGIRNITLVLTVALGVGIFLVVALLRILFSIRLSYLLFILYAGLFTLVAFVPGDILPVAFDSGGVTTGPMTVPFILAMGVGVASIRSDSKAQDDSFGLVALCSVGPILAVLILGIFFPEFGATYTHEPIVEPADSRELFTQFLTAFPHYMHEVAIALSPIAVFFAIFQVFTLKLSKQKLLRIGVGLIYTYVGLVLFLTGVNVGFLPVGSYVGTVIGTLDANWIIVPVGMVIGYFIVAAEPAVHVLNKQVVDMTAGAIPQKALSIGLSISVSIAVGLAMLRILTGMHVLWLIIPGYIIALALTFFTPPIFTAIAFDSGGVASGPMASTFLLPLAIGNCVGVGGNVVTDAFGAVAMVAMMPLITIQILGIIATRRTKAEAAEEEALLVEETLVSDDEIITLEEGEN